MRIPATIVLIVNVVLTAADELVWSDQRYTTASFYAQREPPQLFLLEHAGILKLMEPLPLLVVLLVVLVHPVESNAYLKQK
uniref:Secreted protein n=1 Tax=Steinernema glaseri TaxID=37863 RepID=A0A1I7Y4N1_9BILA